MTSVRNARYSTPAVLLLALLGLVFCVGGAGAATPVVGGQNTEIVSLRTWTRMLPGGVVETLPDLAASGQVLVRLAPTVTPAQLQQLLRDTGCTVRRAYRTPGHFLLGLPANLTVAQGQQLLRPQPLVRSVSPDRVAYPSRTPNDPYYEQQYFWPLIQADRAWDIQTGSAQVVVAVVDSGVDLRHEDLATRIWTNPREIPNDGIDNDGNGFVDDVNGWDFYHNNNDPSPNGSGASTDYQRGVVNHGTHVAGVIGAVTNNGVGIAGHDWACKIMPVQIFRDGSSLFSIILDGFEYAVNNGAQVINLSLGGGYTEIWDEPIALANALGIAVVAAVGNESTPFRRYYLTDLEESWLSPVCNDGPSFLDNYVLGVGATDADDLVTDFSVLSQSSRPFLDVMSPGAEIFSTYYFNPAEGFLESYGMMSGTSMACPITAGLVALVKAQSPQLTPGQIYAQIKAACDNIDSQNPQNVGQMGSGRINSANSLGDMPPGPARGVMAADTPGDQGGSITVSWSLSVDDGRGFNDVVGYDVQRSDLRDGPFTTLATVPPRTRTYVDETVANYTDYYYRIITRDRSNAVPSRVTEPAQARDDLPPPPVTLTATDTPSDRGGSISLSWQSYVAPEDFGEYRIYRAETSFSSVAGMTPIGQLYLATQKAYQDRTVEDNKDYYYAVTAVDNQPIPNEAVEVTAVGPVRSNPNHQFTFPAGLSFIALGVMPHDNSLGAIFAAYPTADFARWDPAQGQSGGYRLHSANPNDSFLRQMPGRGFWMRSNRPVVLDLAGAAPAGEAPIDFVRGWNQLGNPYAGEVSIVGAQVQVGGTKITLAQSNQRGYTRDYVWTYDTFTSSYRLISEYLPFGRTNIRKGEGFFLMADATAKLILAPQAVAPAAVAQSAEEQPGPGRWTMRLEARINGAADTDNFLGVHPQAATFGAIVSPPLSEDGVDLYFPAAAGRTAASFVESLAMQGNWDVMVACQRPGAQVTVAWPDLSQLPRDSRPLLRDGVTGQVTYMRTASAYSFTLSPGETQRSLTVEVNAKVGDALAISGLQSQATSGGVQLTYILSAPAAVDIQLLNLAGRTVRSLQAAGPAGAGLSSALWDGRNQFGVRAPAGVYLARFTARTEDGQCASGVATVRLGR